MHPVNLRTPGAYLEGMKSSSSPVPPRRRGHRPRLRPVRPSPGRPWPRPRQAERRAGAPGRRSRQMDAQSTREELMRILEKHPPSVGRVLKLDPSLMRSESYLASYPELRDFLAQHSEVPQNSQYYLEAIRVSPNEGYQRNDKLELAAAVLAGFAAFMRRRHRAGHAGLADPDRARAAPLEPAVENPGRSALQADGSVFVERRAPDLRPDTIRPPIPRIGPQPAAAGHGAGRGGAARRGSCGRCSSASCCWSPAWGCCS